MTCTVEDGNYHMNDLVFQLNNVNVKSESINVLDNHTASLDIEILTKKMTINCCLDINCNSSYDSLATVIMQIYGKIWVLTLSLMPQFCSRRL